MINVAVDGPAGAGKSSVARIVSKELGYLYIDTGAMYRTLAYKAIKNGIDIKNDDKAVLSMLEDTEMNIRYIDGEQRMLIDGEDVTAFIRTPEVSAGASDIAAIPEVRTWLLDCQRDLAYNNNCIMDGRDIGTNILPNAQVKIFLTASVEARAKRRYDELIQNGQDVTYEKIKEDIIKRDKNDTTRACAPLRMAPDAVLADTSSLDMAESVELVKRIIAEKAAKGNV